MGFMGRGAPGQVYRVNTSPGTLFPFYCGLSRVRCRPPAMRAVPWARPPRLPVCSAACTLRRRLRARVLAGIGLLLPRIASALVCGWIVCII